MNNFLNSESEAHLKKLLILSMEDINSKIKDIEEYQEIRISKIEANLKKELYTFDLKKDANITNYVYNEFGVSLSPSYNKEFTTYTRRVESKYHLWYAIRDKFYYHTFTSNFDLKKQYYTHGKYSTRSVRYPEIFKEYIKKEFQNGSISFQNIPKELIKEIEDYNELYKLLENKYSGRNNNG